MTFYSITGKTAELADPVWARAVKDGHELGNHSRRHVRAGTAADLEAADGDLRGKFGITVYTMASPFGDASYPPLATTRYLINRGVVNGPIAPGDDTDPFNIHCYVPPAARGGRHVQRRDRRGPKWRRLDDGARPRLSGRQRRRLPARDIGEFTASVNHAKSFGDVWIDSVVNVGAYWRAQKLFAGITPTTSGNSTTWTWTLPPHFPPGRVLRVKIDGGTLTQPGGRTLAWDDHGYYEVALDAGSLTLSP